MRQIEFARAGAFVSPVKQEFAVSRKFGDTVVTVTVCDVNAAIRSEGDIGWEIEVSGIHAGSALGANGQKELAVVGKLEDLLERAVSNPYVVVRIDAEAVRFEETIFAP